MISLHPEISAALADPGSYARRWHEKTGNPVIGYFCSYTPDEIITAAGALPFRILGGGPWTGKADAHLQAYSCSLARTSLDAALAGRYDFLAGTVFAHTCDTMQRLSDIWRLGAGFPFHADIVLPVKLDTESARDYFRAVIAGFRDELAKHLHHPLADEDLENAITCHNRIRESFRRIIDVRKSDPGSVPGTVLHQLYRAGMFMDRYRFAEIMEDTASKLPGSTGTAPAHGPRVMLTGGVCDLPDIHSLVEAAGGTIVTDDLCTGTRLYGGPVPARTGNPVEAIADRYRERVICPVKHRSPVDRRDRLLETVREHAVDGVIFVHLKFCDPHAFDYPHLADALKEAGTKTLLLELEGSAATGQLATRIETFMELLENRGI